MNFNSFSGYQRSHRSTVAHKGAVVSAGVVKKIEGEKGKTFSSLKVKLECMIYDESFYVFNENSGLH